MAKGDMRAIKQLIKRYTDKRDWSMVQALFLDLGQMFEEEESNG